VERPDRLAWAFRSSNSTYLVDTKHLGMARLSARNDDTVSCSPLGRLLRRQRELNPSRNAKVNQGRASCMPDGTSERPTPVVFGSNLRLRLGRFATTF
jgi:hypothetical protein